MATATKFALSPTAHVNTATARSFVQDEFSTIETTTIRHQQLQLNHHSIGTWIQPSRASVFESEQIRPGPSLEKSQDSLPVIGSSGRI